MVNRITYSTVRSTNKTKTKIEEEEEETIEKSYQSSEQYTALKVDKMKKKKPFENEQHSREIEKEKTHVS